MLAPRDGSAHPPLYHPHQMTPPAADSASRTVTVLGGVIVTMGITLSRSIRWPNDFAEAHWLLDYRFGFIKRGLSGQILTTLSSPFGGPSEAAIVVAAGAVLIALCAAITWTAWRMARASDFDPAAVLAGLALASSPFVVMTGHLTGYLDGVIVLLGFAAVLAMTGGRPWTAAVLAAVAVLVHESAALVVLPVVGFAWWRVGETRPRSTARVPMLPLLVPVAAFLAVALAGQLTPDVEDAYSARLAAAGFVGGDMHLLVPEWLRPGFIESYRANSHRFAERVAFAEMYGLMLPTALVLVAWATDACRLRPRSVTMALLPLVILAPELLHIAAWDTVRIWTYTIATAMMAVVALTRTAGPAVRAGTVVRGLGLVALTVNVMMMTPLLDNLADRFALTTRLWMYAPVLAYGIWLFSQPHRDSA